eukprot:841469-Prorocentrum_minimum.AAC.3
MEATYQACPCAREARRGKWCSPESGRAWPPYNAYRRIDRTCKLVIASASMQWGKGNAHRRDYIREIY